MEQKQFLIFGFSVRPAIIGWVMLAIIYLLALITSGCNKDNPVDNNFNILSGRVDTLFVSDSTGNGSQVSSNIHLSRLVQAVRIKFKAETNADTSNIPKVIYKFGIVKDSITIFQFENVINLTNSMLDSDVYYFLSVRSTTNGPVFIRLIDINIYSN